MTDTPGYRGGKDLSVRIVIGDVREGLSAD